MSSNSTPQLLGGLLDDQVRTELAAMDERIEKRLAKAQCLGLLDPPSSGPSCPDCSTPTCWGERCEPCYSKALGR